MDGNAQLWFRPWQRKDIEDGERIRLYLLDHLGQDVCMGAIRAAIGVENVRGRISGLRHRGWKIAGAGDLPLCSCHGLQVYRLQSATKGTGVRRMYGAKIEQDFGSPPKVKMQKTGLSGDLDEPNLPSSNVSSARLSRSPKLASPNSAAGPVSPSTTRTTRSTGRPPRGDGVVNVDEQRRWLMVREWEALFAAPYWVPEGVTVWNIDTFLLVAHAS